MALGTTWKWGMLGVALLGGTALAAGRRPAPAVVVSIDGLRVEHVLQAAQLGLQIPQLRRLLAEGAHAEVLGVAGGSTPGLVTLLTGVAPDRHGVLREAPFDPLGAGRAWQPGDVRVPTLGQAMQRAGLGSAAVGWPLAGDGPPFDTDQARAERCAALLASQQPARLVLCRFTSFDEAQHRSGPSSPAARAALAQVDGLLGRVREAAARAGDGRALLVVSAHGCVPTGRAFDLDEVLRRAGLLHRDQAGRLRGWRALAWGEGGSALVVLRDPGDAAGRRLVRAVLADLVRQGLLARFVEQQPPAGSPAPVFTAYLSADARLAGLGPAEVTSEAAGGAHGHDPRLPGISGSLFLLGPGARPGEALGPVDLRDVAPTVAGLLGLRLPEAEGRDLTARRVALASR